MSSTELIEISGRGEFFCVSVGGGRTWAVCHSFDAANQMAYDFHGKIAHRFETRAKANEFVAKRWKDLPYHRFPPLAGQRNRSTGAHEPRYRKEVQAGPGYNIKQ